MSRSLRYLWRLVTWTSGGVARLVQLSWRGLADAPHGPGEAILKWWSRGLLEVAEIRVRAEGVEAVAGDWPRVYCCNHASFVDIWAIFTTLPGALRFVAKRELFRIPVFGTGLRVTGQIPIDRAKRRQAFSAYERAAAAIRGGKSAVVFAEGTRSRDGSLQPFKKGPFVLAIAAQVPVVPVYIAGTHGLLPKGGFVPRRGEVVVRVGAPIPTAGLGYDDRDALLERCRAAVQALAERVDGVAAPR